MNERNGICTGHAAGTLTATVLGGMGDHEKMLAQKPNLKIELASQIADAVILANAILMNV